ncbi:MAG: heat-inducible transcriptional repressor HrcA, partial [Solirubrobacterales bacterium]
LLVDHRWSDLSELNELLGMLERRVSLLGVLSAALSERDVYIRIGEENEAPALRSLAVVAASYGLPQRSLGTVSVIGPVRMDYGTAIASVREAAGELSRVFEAVYED